MSRRATLVLLIVLACVTAPLTQVPSSQPGTRWSVEQLHDAVAPVRAGRKLTPRSWPGGARVAVCLSFDVDNESYLLARGETAPAALSAGEFGATTGLPRVLDLLDRHDLPASFFIPAVSAMLHPQMLREITRRGRHELAVHGWIHEFPPALEAAEEERLLTQAIDFLTRETGRRPVGYRAPAWAFSRHTLGLIRKAGFLYDSSLMAMDEPYEIVADGQPTGLVELGVDWVLTETPYLGRNGALPSPEKLFQVYRDEFDGAYDDGTAFVLTLHPHVSGHRSAFVHLEALVAYMRSKPDVWFATAEQIAEYVKRERPADP